MSSPIGDAIKGYLAAERAVNKACEGMSAARIELEKLIPEGTTRRLIEVSDWDGCALAYRNVIFSRIPGEEPVLEFVDKCEEA